MFRFSDASELKCLDCLPADFKLKLINMVVCFFKQVRSATVFSSDYMEGGG